MLGSSVPILDENYNNKKSVISVLFFPQTIYKFFLSIASRVFSFWIVILSVKLESHYLNSW